MSQHVLWPTCCIAMIALQWSPVNGQIVQFNFSGEIEFAEITDIANGSLPIPEFGPGDSFSASFTIDFNQFKPFFSDAVFEAGTYNAQSFSELLGPVSSFVILANNDMDDGSDSLKAGVFLPFPFKTDGVPDLAGNPLTSVNFCIRGDSRLLASEDSFDSFDADSITEIRIDLLYISPEIGEIVSVSGLADLSTFSFQITDAPEPLLGDVDLNGQVNFLDISPFIKVLANGEFQAEADSDLSGAVNFLDINPFIQILAGN